MPDGFELGEIWCIGVGSVGSCALFFLSLVTRSFEAVLVDGDKVKIENILRSTLFSWCDVGPNKHKVVVASRWLNAVGVESVVPRFAWLDDISERWNKRPIGTPDILIATANQSEVRSVIEAGFPPLQVYATTGRNWQATLFRHLPLCGPCSLCVRRRYAKATNAVRYWFADSVKVPFKRGRRSTPISVIRSRSHDRSRDS